MPLAALLPLLAPAAGAQVLAPEIVAGLEWRELGPAVFGGRIVDIELVPDEPATLFVASATGGLFRTRNNGTTWECIFQHEPVISIGDIAVDPRDPQVVWVGTGEANNQRSSYWGDGVYKTTDGGASWTNVGLRDSHHVGRIVIDPRDSQVVYVAALGHLYTHNAERGLFKTSDGGASWEHVLDLGPEVGVVDVLLDPSRPDTLLAASYERLRRAWHFDGAGPGSAIHKSTDGGRSWRRLGGGLPDGEIGRIGLALFPGDPSIVYATVSNQNERPPEPSAERSHPGFQGSFREGRLHIASVREGSRAAAAGVRPGDVLLRIGGQEIRDIWSYLGALAGHRPGDRLELALRRGAQLVELVLELEAVREGPEEPEEGRGPREVGGEVYRSTDGGESWERRNDDPVGGNPPYYYGQIRVDPRDADRLYLLSIPLHSSDDGGKSWERRNLAGSLHVDHHALAIDPERPERLLLGNDGGLAISYDRGASWDHYDNLPLAQLYAVGIDMQEPYHVYGGTQDNGSWGGPSRSRDPRGIAGGEWYRIGGGDGFYCQVDPHDPDTVYGESQFGALFRFDKRAGERRSIRPPQSDPEGPRDRFNWNSPILVSHHNPRILYFGGNKLFKSLDRGDHWPIVSPDLTTADAEKIAGNVPHCTITTIAESPIDPNLLLVGTDDGLVQRSTDGGVTWTSLAGLFPGVPPNLWVSRVELSRHERGRAWVAFTGYREDDFRPFLYESSDGGRSWRSIAAGLPDSPVNVVREDPRNPRMLWVGSEHGVLLSIDRGASWSPIDAGLPSVAVHDLVVHPRDRELVAATHGRGFFVLDVAALQELGEEVLAAQAHLFEVPDVIELAARRDETSGDRWFRGRNPGAGCPITYRLGREFAEDELRLTVVDLAGREVRELEVERGPGLHRLRWDLRVAAEPADEVGDAEGEGGRRRRPRARSAPPGRYAALLRVGEDELRAEFELRADPLTRP